MLERRSRRLGGLALASCAGHVVLGLSATLITGTRAWPTLKVNHELVLPALALLLLSLAAFVVQGFAGYGLVRSHRRWWWLVTGAFLPVATLGMVLTLDAAAQALTSAESVPPLMKAQRYAEEANKAIVISLSTSTVCALLLSNAAMLHALASVAAVPRAARGFSARVGLWSGVLALLFVLVVELVWQPMRWSSLPAGWVPAGGGFLAAMLVAQALSGHHVAEDTLRASLPPGKSREQRKRHLEVGRSIAARVANVQKELLVVLGAVLASALFAGMVTELAAFRGMLLAISDESLAASARAARIATSLEYLEVPLAVHVVHAVPALVVAFSLAAMSPSRWGIAARLAAPGVALALVGASAMGGGIHWLTGALPEELGTQSEAVHGGKEAVSVLSTGELPRPVGELVVIGDNSIAVNGEPVASGSLVSQQACARTALALGEALRSSAPTYSVVAGVPYSSLKCLVAELSLVTSEINWLVKPRVATLLPAPWSKLAVPLGARRCTLRRGVAREPSLRLAASVWQVRTKRGEAQTPLEGPFEERLKQLNELSRGFSSLDIEADDELASELVLRAIASIGVRTSVALVVSGEVQ